MHSRIKRGDLFDTNVGPGAGPWILLHFSVTFRCVANRYLSASISAKRNMNIYYTIAAAATTLLLILLLLLLLLLLPLPIKLLLLLLY